MNNTKITINTYSGELYQLKENEIFVFGSNTQGRLLSCFSNFVIFIYKRNTNEKYYERKNKIYSF